MNRITMVVIAVYAVACALAHGQDGPLNEPKKSTPIPRTAASDEAPNLTIEHEQMIAMEREAVRRTGSLLKQSLLTEHDPGILKISDVSFYAVKQPKPRVLKKHDLVTIIVREESAFSSKGTTDLKKNADLDAKIDSYIKMNLFKLSIQGGKTPAIAPELKGEANRDFKGDGSVDRTDSLMTRIEAEVLDVKPNGTLVLQARKHIQTDEEEQQIVLTGICRAEDVLVDNTVLSTQLHELDVIRKSKGAVQDTTRRGFVPRLLDFINPF